MSNYSTMAYMLCNPCFLYKIKIKQLRQIQWTKRLWINWHECEGMILSMEKSKQDLWIKAFGDVIWKVNCFGSHAYNFLLLFGCKAKKFRPLCLAKIIINSSNYHFLVEYRREMLYIACPYLVFTPDRACLIPYLHEENLLILKMIIKDVCKPFENGL